VPSATADEYCGKVHLTEYLEEHNFNGRAISCQLKAKRTQDGIRGDHFSVPIIDKQADEKLKGGPLMAES
jgi:hypothetical protein